MEIIATGQNGVQKRDDRTVVEIFSEDRIGFVKEKFLKPLKLWQFPVCFIRQIFSLSFKREYRRHRKHTTGVTLIIC